MAGKHGLSTPVVISAAALVFLVMLAVPASGYRICNFKGTVVDHGWRSMTVKTGGECATVNVSWRTKYIPNRRPCLGERVSVDFTLEDGYMKATKVVSLTSPSAPVECYPPAPPGSTRCRSVVPDAPEESCPSPRQICSRTPPPHVRGDVVQRERPREKPQPRKPRRPAVKPTKKVEEPKKQKEQQDTTEPSPPTPLPPKFNTVSGEVVASSPKSLSIRVMDEQDTAEVMSIRVGLKTKFIPFRRPAVGERVEVEFQQENGQKFGYVVKVIQ